LDDRCCGGEEPHASTKLPVFLFEFLDSSFKVGKLGLSAIARVLCGDTVPVSAGFLAFFGR
jgi:hypothetical protein